MTEIVIYGIGSSFLVEIEESLFRARVAIRAGLRNRPGDSFLAPEVPIFAADAAPETLRGLPFMVPFFTPGDRQKAALEAEAAGFALPFTLLDPTAATPRSLSVGPGTYVNAGCALGAHASFGRFVFVNRGASVGHHARLGDYVSIGPGAVVSGRVTIGRGTVIGAGAVVLPNQTLGDNVVIGAGAVVTGDVPDNCLLVGNPGRVVRRGIAGYGGVGVD